MDLISVIEMIQNKQNEILEKVQQKYENNINNNNNNYIIKNEFNNNNNNNLEINSTQLRYQVDNIKFKENNGKKNEKNVNCENKKVKNPIMK